MEPQYTTQLIQDYRSGPLITQGTFCDMKDPCPVFDGKQWHIFASGGRKETGEWHMLHAVSDSLTGPWTEVDPALIPGAQGGCPAAPGVVYDNNEKLFHMFIQSDCFALEGTVEHRISRDGHVFEIKETVLRSISGTGEAGIYDPHPTIIHDEKYLVYSGMPIVGRPDLYLAKSTTNSWYGPWERLGKIVSHEEIVHHNQHDHPDYEWGLEGAQLVELPDGRVLLNAVCFLPEGERGTRQRVFFAVADSVTGPYRSLGPMILPTNEGWESGENGHAAAVLNGPTLHLFYQARGITEPWRFGYTTFSVETITPQISLTLPQTATDSVSVE